MSQQIPHNARPFVLHEANYRQMQELAPNVAVLPWGATEAHNYHLPYGTDNIEAQKLGEAAVERANSQRARCVLLPTMPFGIDHSQLYQVATITMRVETQLRVLRDVAESLVLQGINRLVLLNFHGGNDFKPLIRDVMFDLPIFIVLVNGHQLAPERDELIENAGDHADEFETSLILHLEPQWVAPLETAGDGTARQSTLPSLSQPGIWATRDWQTLTCDTGSGDPHRAAAEKGQQIFDMLVDALTPALVELSNAQNGDFPFVLAAR